ncbi:MAG: AraC family transcriptional regulator [Planctomycetota bacterium]|nr:AraC family transcriptional regulator [Planctomycetota bacterium]
MNRGEIPQANDALGETLRQLRMSGVFYCRSEFSKPWGLVLPPMSGALMFHIVISGGCFLEIGEGKSRVLRAGDMALLPKGEGHRLLSSPGIEAAPLFDLPREAVSDRYEILRHGGGGEETLMICGAVNFEDLVAGHFLEALPDFIHVDSWTALEMDWLQSTLRLMGREARELRPGGETIIARLSDILVVQAIRSWLANDPEARTGWLGALRDPALGIVLSKVHRDPGYDWTVETMAQQGSLSRSVFAARFSESVGQTPMQYVTNWRVRVACRWLRDTDLSLVEIAQRLGYRSVAAFGRAFKRVRGISPGALRKLPTASFVD